MPALDLRLNGERMKTLDVNEECRYLGYWARQWWHEHHKRGSPWKSENGTRCNHKPLLTRTILMSNDSSSSSHLLRGEGETVWKREKWRENKDTRKENRYPVLGVRESRHCSRREIVWQQRLFAEGEQVSQWGDLRLASQGEKSTHLVLCAQLQKLISSVPEVYNYVVTNQTSFQELHQWWWASNQERIQSRFEKLHQAHKQL